MPQESRSVDIIIRDTLGNLMSQIIQLQAAIEVAQARIKELEAKDNGQAIS